MKLEKPKSNNKDFVMVEGIARLQLEFEIRDKENGESQEDDYTYDISERYE